MVRMVEEFVTKYHNFAPDNILFHTKTHKCWIRDETGKDRVDDLLELRWYPPSRWESLDLLEYPGSDLVAARIMLECLYGKSPYFDEDEARFRENVKMQKITC